MDVPQERKRALYAKLALDGLTMKDWFIQVAEGYCKYGVSTPLFPIPAEVPGLGSWPDNASFKTVSMFSGCGGMDLGFLGDFEIFGRHYGKNPFEIIWANDFNQAACETYAHNFQHPIHCGSVWDHLDSLPESADVVIGGFPCQDISINGKGLGVAGKRSGLYRAMVETVRRLEPAVFVAENVKGLLLKSREESLRQVSEDFSGLGYDLNVRLYRAADYGVPQLRERVFIVGTRKGFPGFEPPTPERNRDCWLTSREALGDLEDMPENVEFSHIWSKARKSPEQGSRIISADRPAHTIRAECHGNIQFHYRLDRRLSMREAARIQTFPDDFIFKSKLRETERQIGNAVPPVLAWHMANAVAKYLVDLKSIQSVEQLRRVV